MWLASATAPLLPRALSRLRRGRQPALADAPSHPEAGLTPLVAALAHVIKQHTLHPNGFHNRWCAWRQRVVERPPQLADVASLANGAALSKKAVQLVHLDLHQPKLGFAALRSLTGRVHTAEGVNHHVQGYSPRRSAHRAPHMAGVCEHLVTLAADSMLAHLATGGTPPSCGWVVRRRQRHGRSSEEIKHRHVRRSRRNGLAAYVGRSGRRKALVADRASVVLISFAGGNNRWRRHVALDHWERVLLSVLSRL